MVNTNPVPFTAIGADQPRNNKVHIARLADETEQMLGVTQPTRTQHHDLRGANRIISDN